MEANTLKLSQLDLPAGLERRIVFEPEVRVLARTAITDFELAEQLEDREYPSYTRTQGDWPHDDAEYLIEYAGRSCYQSFHNPANRTTGEYIGNIIQQKHYSVLEHASVTFNLEGVSRSFTHELIRHRHLSFSQLSQRYVNASDARYVCPPLYREDKQLFWNWVNSLTYILPRVDRLVSQSESKYAAKPRKVHREAARALLPNCAETKIVVTGNLRAWRDFLEKRWSSHADAEIAEVAGLIAEELKALYPSVFEDIHYGD